MPDKEIKSGPEIVKEFIEHLLGDESLDKDTIEIISALYKENKLTVTRLQQALDAKRKDS